MALLQPRQQQQSWFFIDLEEDGGICEVEVDVVGCSLVVLLIGTQNSAKENVNNKNLRCRKTGVRGRGESVFFIPVYRSF